MTSTTVSDLRHVLCAMFDAAVAAADPMTCLARHLPDRPTGRTVVIGAGKAAARMAAAVEQAWPRTGGGQIEGLVVTRYGHVATTERIEVIEAAHPVPDLAGLAAAARILELARSAGPDDLVLCLMSGGASALLALPAEGLTLDDKQEVNRALLKSGATIGEMNAVRKHLSRIKGGRLAAAAHPARLITLAISDVPGDAPDVIGSGPTVPDPSTRRDAIAILDKHGIVPPAAVRAHLGADDCETPKPGDPVFDGTEFRLIAAPQISLEAAAAVALNHGLCPIILGDAIEGEARDVALVHAGIAKQVRRHGQPRPAPAVILSGGETTVTVRGRGRGGRNAEFLLALAIALDGAPGIAAFAGDTDGVDGTEENAGAILVPDTLARARASGLDAKAMLANNDGYGFFATLGDLVITGPTLTNVNDFRAIIVLP
ncbi:MAG: glycerate kinase [Hyphomicrobiaceae bacterium]